jgi:peroxiredoxin
MLQVNQIAPELQVETWLNSAQPISLAGLRGRVVVLHAFQMLCPGCVLHGLPQAQAVRAMFSERDVAVIGLHTVFEHHAVTGAAALKAFLHEYRINFPVGIDMPSSDREVPRTMQAYGLRGTPSVLVLDKAGVVQLHQFGRVDDMRMGALIGTLLAQTTPQSSTQADGSSRPASSQQACDDERCERPST